MSTVVSLVELSKSLVNDIEESWNTERIPGDRADDVASSDTERTNECEDEDGAHLPDRDDGIELEEVSRNPTDSVLGEPNRQGDV